MIKCLIVDDEPSAIDILVHHIGATDYLTLAGTATSGTAALHFLNHNEVDLLFQDIHMPDLSGIDLVKAIPGKCAVIFTTAYSQYAVEGFDLGVIDYLLKPISYPRFITAVQKVIEKARSAAIKVEEKQSMPDHIYVKTGLRNSVLKVVLSEVAYFESRNNYVAIHHNKKETLVYISMKDLVANIPAGDFIRVHRSYIVSLARISGVEGSEIILKDVAERIPLGDSYRAAFWEALNDKIIG